MLKTLKVVRQWWSSFWVFRSFKNSKNMTESFSSRFIKLSYDAQISWNIIFSVGSTKFLWLDISFFDYCISLIISLTMHFNLHEERCRAHFSTYCKSYFLTTQMNDFTYTMSEAAVPSFRHTAFQNIFGNTGRRVLMLVMTVCGNFTFNWIFCVYSFSQLISLRIKRAKW